MSQHAARVLHIQITRNHTKISAERTSHDLQYGFAIVGICDSSQYPGDMHQFMSVEFRQGIGDDIADGGLEISRTTVIYPGGIDWPLTKTVSRSLAR
jgi:hypothetical protein